MRFGPGDRTFDHVGDMAVLAHTVPFAGIAHHQGLDADVLQRNEELY